MKKSLEIFPKFQKKDEFPFKDSLLALTLEAEIKRTALEREEPVGETIKKLAKLVGCHERQIYNYRSGKTQIPEDKIFVFIYYLALNFGILDQTLIIDPNLATILQAELI